MALLASLIRIKFGLSVVLVGAVLGNIPGLKEQIHPTEVTTFLTGAESLMLTLRDRPGFVATTLETDFFRLHAPPGHQVPVHRARNRRAAVSARIPSSPNNSSDRRCDQPDGPDALASEDMSLRASR